VDFKRRDGSPEFSDKPLFCRRFIVGVKNGGRNPRKNCGDWRRRRAQPASYPSNGFALGGITVVMMRDDHFAASSPKRIAARLARFGIDRLPEERLRTAQS
jgi:hypothetical protein